MKLILGNGWEQEVKTENGKEVIRYLKEYTKEEYENLKDNPQEENTLKEMVQELDSSIGGLNLRLASLDDVGTEIGWLDDELTNIDHENIKYYLTELKHKVRIIANLHHYLMEDLKKDYGEIENLNSDLFKKVVTEK